GAGALYPPPARCILLASYTGQVPDHGSPFLRELTMESDGNRNLSRRAVLAMPLLAAALPILEQPSLASEVHGTAPRPFRVNIPEATIRHILNRVRDTRWPDRLDATDWRYGANWDY